jgi:phage gpG-like protein
MQINIEAFGVTELDRTIVRVSERAEDMRPVWVVLHKRFVEMERRQFSSQGISAGGWRPLTPATIARKAQMGLDTQIMHATHRLRDSLTRTGHADHVYRPRKDEVFFGTRVPYAGPHQRPRSSNPLPQRRLVAFTESERREWVKAIQRYIVTGRA